MEWIGVEKKGYTDLESHENGCINEKIHDFIKKNVKPLFQLHKKYKKIRV